MAEGKAKITYVELLKEDLCIFRLVPEDGIRDSSTSRGLGDVYKRQPMAWVRSRVQIPSGPPFITKL